MSNPTSVDTPGENAVYARLENAMKGNKFERVTESGDRLDRKAHMAVILPRDTIVQAYNNDQSVTITLHPGDVEALLHRLKKKAQVEQRDAAQKKAARYLSEISEHVAVLLGEQCTRPGLVTLDDGRTVHVDVWPSTDNDGPAVFSVVAVIRHPDGSVGTVPAVPQFAAEVCPETIAASIERYLEEHR